VNKQSQLRVRQAAWSRLDERAGEQAGRSARARGTEKFFAWGENFG